MILLFIINLVPLSYFAVEMGKLGVQNKDHVVVYDTSDTGLFSAARLWWMLR